MEPILLFIVLFIAIGFSASIIANSSLRNTITEKEKTISKLNTQINYPRK